MADRRGSCLAAAMVKGENGPKEKCWQSKSWCARWQTTEELGGRQISCTGSVGAKACQADHHQQQQQQQRADNCDVGASRLLSLFPLRLRNVLVCLSVAQGTALEDLQLVFVSASGPSRCSFESSHLRTRFVATLLALAVLFSLVPRQEPRHIPLNNDPFRRYNRPRPRVHETRKGSRLLLRTGIASAPADERIQAAPSSLSLGSLAMSGRRDREKRFPLSHAVVRSTAGSVLLRVAR